MDAASLILGLTLAAQALPATESVRWEEVLPADNSGRNFIDPASLRRDGEAVTFLMRSIGHRPTPEGVAAYNMRVTIHCRARTFTLLAVDSYGADGRLISSLALSTAQLRPVPIHEINSDDKLSPRVCGGGEA